ncbi:hypothetical protein J7384_02695 [Endozoicomonas sp. G2_1]|uniref:LamG domain-containing protein n=1 Tax=Endozoicomonas sp. G2_1 TaxID=2821091 RepID=UPI001AD9C7F7|nr:LamG domain-containing protein [Endozoicomonas sp. G2_1]MBO9489264.1 hypothetical protein [Endozoicomonas sp. G2_1]
MLLLTQNAWAAQCSAVFPDVLSTHGNGVGNSQINFGFNARLLNNPDTVLNTRQVNTNAGSTVSSCQGTNCTASGTSGETASFNFRRGNGNVSFTPSSGSTITFGTTAVNNYNRVGEASNVAFNFSDNHDVYFFERLALGFNSTLNLSAGKTYYIRDLSVASNVTINVVGSGTAQLFIDSNTTFGSSAIINSNGFNSIGDVSKLVVHIDGNFSLNSQSTFSGALYAENITLVSASHLFGVASGRVINLNANSTATYDNTVFNADFGEVCELPPPEPFASYRMDEFSWAGSSGEVVDQTGNFNATAVNGANTANVTPALSGSPGTCHYGDFDGSNDYVALPSNFENLQGDFTIAAWVFPTARDRGNRIFADDENNTRGYAFSLGDPGPGRLRFYSRGVNPVSVDTTSAVPLNQWSFVTAVHNSVNKTRQIYINGVAQRVTGGSTVNTYTGNWGVDTGLASIGGETNRGETGNRFDGLLDEVQVYKSALTQRQIAELFAQRHDCLRPGPLAHYQFEQDAWSGNNSILDTSGNNNHGSPLGNISPLIPSPVIPVAGGSCQAMDVPRNTNNGQSALNTNLDLDSQVGNRGTISFWYKSDNAWRRGGRKTLFDASIGNGRNNGRDAVFFLEIRSGRNSGRVRFITEDINDRNFEFSSQQRFNFAANTWVHIALSWDLVNRDVQLFINGNAQNMNRSIQSRFVSQIGNLTSLRIGDNSSSNNGFGSLANSADGQFDDVRVYNFVQNSAQVQADREDVSPCIQPSVNHYRINHPGAGVTCEPLAMQIRACANADCSNQVTTSSSISLLPTGFSGTNVSNNTVSLSGSAEQINLSVAAAGRVTLSRNSALPDAPLRCFIGDSDSTNESCEVSFADTALLLDVGSQQVAESTFTGVRLRAVERNSNTGACGAALSGQQNVNVSYSCSNPGQCRTSLNVGSTVINGVRQTGNTTAVIPMTFNNNGEASVPSISFADAGRIAISASVNANNVNLTSSTVGVDVIPDRLVISAPNFAAAPVAGQSFELRLAALGANGRELPNYLPANIETQESLVQPVGGRAGDVSAYGTPLSLTSNGVYEDNAATYSETGTVELVIVDSNYLGSHRLTSNALTLSNFVPSYYNVVATTPNFVNANNGFTYVGQPFRFSLANSLSFTIEALNESGEITRNYDDGNWGWNKSALIPNSFGFTERSGYRPDNLVVFPTPSETVTDNGNLDGDLVVTLADLQVYHQKSTTPVRPFNVDIDLAISANYFTDSDLCYKNNASDVSCLGLSINDLVGANMRYGRLQLISNQSDENQALFLPLQVEYFDSSGNYVLNTDDSRTLISVANSDIDVSSTSSNALVNAINSTSPQLTRRFSSGRMIGSNGLPLGSPGIAGEALIQLLLNGNSQLNLGTWRYFLNVDRDDDGDIDNNDRPQATGTFGRFRGNDRIILWREQL